MGEGRHLMGGGPDARRPHPVAPGRHLAMAGQPAPATASARTEGAPHPAGCHACAKHGHP
eukprot:4501846-Lingulodinium_polyedra.AAC.1